MKITRICPFTNQINVRDIPITEAQMDRWLGGLELIQDVMPELSADDREFMISGITPEMWEKTFGGEE